MFNIIKPSLKTSVLAVATYSLSMYSGTFKALNDSYNAMLQVSSGWKILTGQQPMPSTIDYALLSLKLVMHSAKIAGYLVSNSFHLALGCSAATAVSYAASYKVNSDLDKVVKKLEQMQAEAESSADGEKNLEEIQKLNNQKATLEYIKYYVDGAYDTSLGVTKYFVSLYLMNKAKEYVEKVMSDFNNSGKKAPDQAKEAEPPKEQKLAQDGLVEQPNKATPPQDGLVEQSKQVLDKAQPVSQQESVLLVQKQEGSELRNEVVVQHKDQMTVQVGQVEGANKPVLAQDLQLEQQNHALVVQNQAASALQKATSAHEGGMPDLQEQLSVQGPQFVLSGQELSAQEQAILQLQNQVMQQGHLLSAQAHQFAVQEHMLAQAQQLEQHHQLALKLQAAQQAQYVSPPLVVQPPLLPVVKPTLVSVLPAQVDNPEASFEQLFSLPASPKLSSDPQPLEDLVSSAKAMTISLLEASKELLDSYQGTIRDIAPDKVQGEHGVTGLKYLNNILFSTPQGTNEHTMVYVDPVYPLGEVMQFLPNMVLKSNL